VQVNSSNAGERNLGSINGKHAVTGCTKDSQRQSCGRIWASSKTCTVQHNCSSALQSRGEDQSSYERSDFNSFTYGNRDYPSDSFFLYGYGHSGCFGICYAYHVEFSTSSITIGFCSVTSPCCYCSTGPCRAVPPPKQMDWSCQFHLEINFTGNIPSLNITIIILLDFLELK
jgi:hypothetical protein